MRVFRAPENPIISPKDVTPTRPDFQVVCVFNAGVARFRDETILLLRVAEIAKSNDPDWANAPLFDPEKGQLIVKTFRKDDPEIDFSDSRFIRTPERGYLSSISHLRLARSRDGLSFQVDKRPALEPQNLYEMYGIEDPRITLIDGVYFITYSAISPISGITACLASTTDFETFQRRGVIFVPDNKDVILFPRKIGGSYFALHRPAAAEFGLLDIWVSESPDLINWGRHRHLMGPRPGMWDGARVGGGAVPFETDAGWLAIYHGADQNDRYCLGAVLLDRRKPWKVLARSATPILEPEAAYERQGFFGNVVFTCGALLEGEVIKVYYGAADTCMAYAELRLDDVRRSLSSG